MLIQCMKARLAINVNIVANVVLVAAKAVASFYSTSLSLIASLADSVLDLLSRRNATWPCSAWLTQSPPSDDDHLRHSQACDLEVAQAVAAVSSWKKAPATSRHTGIQRRHGCIVHPDPARVCSAVAIGRARSRAFASRRNWLDAGDNRSERLDLVRMRLAAELASPGFGAGLQDRRSFQHRVLPLPYNRSMAQCLVARVYRVQMMQQ